MVLIRHILCLNSLSFWLSGESRVFLSSFSLEAILEWRWPLDQCPWNLWKPCPSRPPLCNQADLTSNTILGCISCLTFTNILTAMPLTKQDEFVSLYARVLILTTQLPNYQEYTKSADNGTRKQIHVWWRAASQSDGLQSSRWFMDIEKTSLWYWGNHGNVQVRSRSPSTSYHVDVCGSDLMIWWPDDLTWYSWTSTSKSIS